MSSLTKNSDGSFLLQGYEFGSVSTRKLSFPDVSLERETFVIPRMTDEEAARAFAPISDDYSTPTLYLPSVANPNQLQFVFESMKGSKETHPTPAPLYDTHFPDVWDTSVNTKATDTLKTDTFEEALSTIQKLDFLFGLATDIPRSDVTSFEHDKKQMHKVVMEFATNQLRTYQTINERARRNQFLRERHDKVLWNPKKYMYDDETMCLVFTPTEVA